MFFVFLLAIAAVLALPTRALAQGPVEVEVDNSAAADLYMSRRPPVPSSPKIPKELRALLLVKEKAADAKRAEAIGLLRAFLDSRPKGLSRAEGLFKLAELLWEDTRRKYLLAMDRHQRELERCRQAAKCKRTPKEPDLDLSEPERYYRMLLADHPAYNRIDLVLYLVGFAAREDGRIEESLDYFRQVIEKHKDSPLYGDSWMMVGEFYFQAFEWEQARTAYASVLSDEQSESYDLALFKTCWCDWKIGDTEEAKLCFKKVLDEAEKARLSGNARQRKRREQLRDEALDYLVLVFTEDESIKAKDVYDFLASIGGEQYSAAVLKRLAEVYYTQGRWQRSVESYKFLIGLDPDIFAAAKYQREIVNAWLEALEADQAMEEIKILVKTYGAKSEWAKANKQRKRSVDRHIAETEKLVRGLATRFHADAQDFERDRKAPDLNMYKRAASTYEYYLAEFDTDENANEVRFLRAEILYYKLERIEEAGDQYLLVGRTAPVGKRHKDALKKAMLAFKRLRPKDLGSRRKLSPVDKKFAAATDLYADLFPGDKEIVVIVFENGQLFYDYGDYDEAIKRFGLIVTKYPNDKNAGAAGDKILEALNKAEDFENIEEWARKLKKAPAFESGEEQKRLDRLIVKAIGSSGDKYSNAGKYAKAAEFYERVPDEFPKHALAAQSLFNAAVMYEKAKKPEKAANTYLSVADRYQDSDQFAEKSAYTAAQVYESIGRFDRAAKAYELVAERHPNSAKGADALFNAGVLRQALGQSKRAIRHYELYAKRFRGEKKDAEEVAFRVGVVYEDSDQDGRAAKAFDKYVASYRRGKFVIEAVTRSGRAQFALGKTTAAQKKFRDALARYKKTSGEARKLNAEFAAESRYHLGEVLYRAYDNIKLDVKPRKLDRLLKQKQALLTQAEGIYVDVIEFGDPQWATAGLYRVGAIYEEFAVALREAPPPPGLTEDEKTAYRDELDKYVIAIEEKAIELYRSGYETAKGLNVYNKFTKKLREALGRLSPSNYPPENESRAAQRLGDRVPAPPIVKEIVRDDE